MFKKVVTFLLAIAFIGGAWLYSNEEISEEDAALANAISDNRIPYRQTSTRESTKPINNDDTAKLPVEHSIDAELEEAFERAINSFLSTTHRHKKNDTEPKPAATTALVRFEGNSDYTGDDTEDNDAGNSGFEDDFPEAKYAYDDHSAEAYSNYTESYIYD